MSKKEGARGASCISGNARRESSCIELIFVDRSDLYTNPICALHLSSCSPSPSCWPILLPSDPRGREMLLLTYEKSPILPDACYWDNPIVTPSGNFPSLRKVQPLKPPKSDLSDLQNLLNFLTAARDRGELGDGCEKPRK